MCYLTIKEMSCIAEDVIIVTSRRVLVSEGSTDTEPIFSRAPGAQTSADALPVPFSPLLSCLPRPSVTPPTRGGLQRVGGFPFNSLA